jgi:hypothetical protein
MKNKDFHSKIKDTSFIKPTDTDNLPEDNSLIPQINAYN